MRKKKMNETCSQIRTYSITRENKSNFFGRIEIQTACTVSKNPFPTVSIFAPVSLIVCDNLVPFHLFELRYVGTNPSHVSRVPDYSTCTTPLTTII
jgi:hypothetical protein